MFEFFVFQAGGLILWPMDIDPASKSLPIVNEYVQKQLLEGKSSEEVFFKDKIACLTLRKPEYNLFFAVTLSQQIAQQISYLAQLIDGVAQKFIFQFEQVLTQTDYMIVPSFFSKFNVDDIINQFRGTTGRVTETIKIVDDLSSDSEIKPSSNKRNSSSGSRVGSPGSNRRRHTDKNGSVDVEKYSHVIGSVETPPSETKIVVEQYDLEDFEGVFLQPKASSSGFFGNVMKGIVGEKVLTSEALTPFLTQFESHLISKNVASTIASELTRCVGSKLEGTKCGTFSSVKNVIVTALKEQIERILTPHRSLDVIRDIQNAKARGQPYVLSFIGVNGVGKSTTLAKIAYLFKSHGFKVLITACDTFRSGAIDQLEEHSRRLEIELFQKGGSRRDPVPVARESINYACENHFDVVLIDTAGRMQNSEGLMKQIARLINEVKPDLTLFVAEALVGNNGSDQIQTFDQTLKRHGGSADSKGIDGIVLTKFDTIDDKVGAALTLVYETGHPIIYLGVGQTYRDLRRMNPEFVVDTLIRGI